MQGDFGGQVGITKCKIKKQNSFYPSVNLENLAQISNCILGLLHNKQNTIFLYLGSGLG